MAAKFDLTDDSVVVIVGSGAGGGTLANEWESFSNISWLDKRTTSGSWRVAKDFPNLPAWIVKSVGGSTVHWAGASLRFQEHEFKTRTTYGNIKGANLLDWPLTLQEL